MRMTPEDLEAYERRRAAASGYSARPDAPLESDIQQTITDFAELNGWRWYHTHDSRRSAAGFPDLVLWRERVVFAEIKRPGQHLRPEQATCIDGLAAAGAEVYVWWEPEPAFAVLRRRRP
jgi:hypothetical protein